MTGLWFVPESFGRGLVPVAWQGFVAIAAYFAVVMALLVAVVLLLGDAWWVAALAAMAIGALTYAFLKFVATKTDRSQSGETYFVMPYPFDSFR
jgi:hypothetical protein